MIEQYGTMMEFGEKNGNNEEEHHARVVGKDNKTTGTDPVLMSGSSSNSDEDDDDDIMSSCSAADAPPESSPHDREEYWWTSEPQQALSVEEGGQHGGGAMRRRTGEMGSGASSSIAETFASRGSFVHLSTGQKKELSSVSCAAIVVNYIGAGYLLLPYAFSQAGTLLSSLGLAFVAIQSFVTAAYVLEACARAEALQNVIVEETSRHGRQYSFPRRYSYAIRHRTYELSELCRIFLNSHMRIFFSFTTACDLYGISWAFAAVFGSTIADKLPMLGTNDDDYKVAVLIFMAIAVPLSCVPVTDQLALQFIFLDARVIVDSVVRR